VAIELGGPKDVVKMTDAGRDAQPVEPLRGEAGYKAHKQAIAAANDRARAEGKRQRLEREERETAKRLEGERREDAEFARRLNARQPG
jgi:hypothetical protein